MRVLGITLPEKKRMEIALTAVYGIGRSRAQKILTQAGVEFGAKPNALSQQEEQKIREVIETLRLEGDLRREVSSNIKRLKDIKSYRGTRHTRRLPSRGQRTKTNCRTSKGNIRKTMGSGRKAVDKK